MMVGLVINRCMRRGMVRAAGGISTVAPAAVGTLEATSRLVRWMTGQDGVAVVTTPTEAVQTALRRLRWQATSPRLLEEGAGRVKMKLLPTQT